MGRLSGGPKGSRSSGLRRAGLANIRDGTWAGREWRGCGGLFGWPQGSSSSRSRVFADEVLWDGTNRWWPADRSWKMGDGDAHNYDTSGGRVVPQHTVTPAMAQGGRQQQQ